MDVRAADDSILGAVHEASALAAGPVLAATGTVGQQLLGDVPQRRRRPAVAPLGRLGRLSDGSAGAQGLAAWWMRRTSGNRMVLPRQ